MAGHYDFSALSILVVDDCDFVSSLIINGLKAMGLTHLSRARNGHEGIASIRASLPDVVFCDWIMEPMNGADFIRFVRQSDESPDPYLPIIVVTSAAEQKRVEEARDIGATEFLSKPVSPADLYERLVSVVERPRAFLRTDTFFGPDRRRKIVPNYHGPVRRNSDTNVAAATSPPPTPDALSGLTIKVS